jgi:hypothetical protein
VLRGGAWNNNPVNCRSAYRNYNTPDNRNNNNGFRLLRAPARRNFAVETAEAGTGGVQTCSRDGGDAIQR